MSLFTVNIADHEEVKIVNLNGVLDAHTASDLEDHLKSLIENGNHKIVVNFRELQYIASAGLGVFMAYIEDVRDRKGDIKLCEMTDKVFNVFDLLGFPVLYDITKTQSEAIQKFKG